jgi:hypothetical protein
MASKKEYYQGVRFAPYDLVREFVVALVVVTGLVIIIAGVFSSPDVPSLTLKTVALQTPQNFVQNEIDSLDGNSPVAGYGPPYNNQSGSVQTIGPISLQKWFGVHIPVNTAQDYVLGPLQQTAAGDSQARAALSTFDRASASTQANWETAYGGPHNNVLAKATEHGTVLTVPACAACGPVPTMMARLLVLGQSGAMDGLLLTSRHFYQTDYTRPLLFINYTDAMANEATKYNLKGSAWGVMNETGNYPGQAWLWLYTLFYQISPYTTAWAANTDALAILSVTILSLLLMLLPWIPGLNRIPRIIPVYRLIWRDHYRKSGQS